jgi:hypothetical protein
MKPLVDSGLRPGHATCLGRRCRYDDIAGEVREKQTVRVLNRPGIGEAAASVICLVAVLATLVAVDGRVRERFSALVTQASSEGFASWEERAGAFGNAVVQAARDRSLDQAPLLVFTVVAAALLIFMLST